MTAVRGDQSVSWREIGITIGKVTLASAGGIAAGVAASIATTIAAVGVRLSAPGGTILSGSSTLCGTIAYNVVGIVTLPIVILSSLYVGVRLGFDVGTSIYNALS
jgi:hypothetical protein